HCTVCHAVLSGLETIDAPGHDPEVTQQGYAASCERNGRTEEIICRRCGTTLASSTTIPATGHKKIVDVAAKEAKCEENGCTEGWHCENCDYEVRSTTITMLRHDMQPVAGKDPTCMEGGWFDYELCSRPGCGFEFNYIPRDPVDHDFMIGNTMTEYCIYGCGTKNPKWVDDPNAGGNGTGGNNNP
ncbi:MAG: hypothetical protein J6X14_10475, partial [Lachnospiraceae bacterium]|nr:hypothetical protein [Lachnospiraceae bacterium]